MAAQRTISPLLCYPNYVEFQKEQVVTVMYEEPVALRWPRAEQQQQLVVRIVDGSSGAVVDWARGQWNGDRVFTFTTPALQSFGYFDITPVLSQGGGGSGSGGSGGGEWSLSTFSLCCSSSWELYQLLLRLRCPQAMLPLSCLLQALGRGNPLMADPYWDIAARDSLESTLAAPGKGAGLGLTHESSPGETRLADMFEEVFRSATLQDFCSQHGMVNTHSSLLSSAIFTAVDSDDEVEDHNYEDMDELRENATVAHHTTFSSETQPYVTEEMTDIYEDTTSLQMVTTGAPHQSGSGQSSDWAYIKLTSSQPDKSPLVQDRSPLGQDKSPMIRSPLPSNQLRQDKSPMIRSLLPSNPPRPDKSPMIRSPLPINPPRPDKSPMIRSPLPSNPPRPDKSPMIRSPLPSNPPRQDKSPMIRSPLPQIPLRQEENRQDKSPRWQQPLAAEASLSSKFATPPGRHPHSTLSDSDLQIIQALSSMQTEPRERQLSLPYPTQAPPPTTRPKPKAKGPGTLPRPKKNVVKEPQHSNPQFSTHTLDRKIKGRGDFS